MQQAILITAYKKEVNQLLRIINYFPDNFVFYIHIDKKTKVDLTPLKNITHKNIKIYRNFSVNWGGSNFLKSIILLATEALKDNKNSFFHLISESDFPTKSIDYFENTLDKSKDYLEFFELPHKVWGGNGGLDRIEYYNLYNQLNGKKSNIAIQYIVALQKKLGLKRYYSNDLPKPIGGSAWWSLTRDTLHFVIQYTNENKKLLRRMNFTFAADEMYFQTVIMNSEFTKNVINDNLRYIDWESGRGGYPAFLDSNDFTEILASNKLFARKFDEETAKKLNHFLTSKGRLSDIQKIVTINFYPLIEQVQDIISSDFKFMFA